MDSLQHNPLKLYIQDIFRANRTANNKYIYELFGLTFKNIMIHGIVTAICKIDRATISFQISDPTGSVQVYYDSKKANNRIPEKDLKDLFHEYEMVYNTNSKKIPIMETLKDALLNKVSIDFKLGDYVYLIGDIFVDTVKNTRMVAAYECNVTSSECDIVWITELQYLYENFYLWNVK